MKVNSVLSRYSHCKQYELNCDAQEYLHYIESTPFYIEPSISDIKTDTRISTLNPKFILFSAPGATGKSSLAKFIAYKFGALYWNLAKVKLGSNSFAGSILAAVGAGNYSDFISNLNTGKMILVIDALDEAEIISGRKMLSSFIADISNSLDCHTIPSVIFLARTETAQFVASYCAENSIPFLHYEIGFFYEEESKEFIRKRITEKGRNITPADEECINSYYNIIKHNITEAERMSFLGYAPVLEAISEHIKLVPNRLKLQNEISSQSNCVSIVMKIMEDLLDREQKEKVGPAFKERCSEEYQDCFDWQSVYSQEEQLVRIVWYILFGNTAEDVFPNNNIPPQLVDDYQEILDTFIPQHPFVRNELSEGNASKRCNFTGPAFRDYALARLILNEQYMDLAQMYFDDAQCKSYSPSQMLFDCYTELSKGIIYSQDIAYLYDSFKAKATALERPYLQCSEIPGDGDEKNYLAIFGIVGNKKKELRDKEKDQIILDLLANGHQLTFDNMSNISIDAPALSVKIGKFGTESRITNSSIICKQIEWATNQVAVESYSPEGCLIVSNENMIGEFPLFDIVNKENLHVSAPNIKQYHRLVPYKYDFDDTTNPDITKFIYFLRCILMEFRTHKKDTLAKTADRIEHVIVGNSESKRQILDYLKSTGVIYPAEHLYKINESKMKEKGIFFEALARMDVKLLETAYDDFCKWLIGKCETI